jgi:diguanylate cyclase (GGDEF)-like protein
MGYLPPEVARPLNFSWFARLALVRIGIRVAGVIALTAVLAWLGLNSGRGPGHVPAVWWADAALVSMMLLEATGGERRPEGAKAAPMPSGSSLRHLLAGGRRRHWPYLLAAGYVGIAIAHAIAGDPAAQAVLLSACDILESSIAAYSVGFVLRDGADLTEQKQLLLFVAFAVVLGPLAASVAAGCILHWLAGSGVAVALHWFPPRALGMAVVPPLVLGLARRETLDLFHRRRLANTLLYLLLIALATLLTFSRSEIAVLFLIIPLLLFLAVRLGLSGGALGCCVVAALGTAITIERSSGAFMQEDPSLEHGIFLLQMFLAAAVLSVSVIAVVLAELQRASRDVHESETRYCALAASMEMLAALDPLTQVANRRCFDEALDREWQRALRARTPLSLILFDADYFKAYNDCYGHLAGDQCLKKIAEIFTSTVRRPADVVARFGGEEFGIILPETDAAGAFRLAESLRLRVEKLSWTHAASPSGIMTLSGGCASMTPLVGETATDLLNSADEALYEAKKEGRNRIESAVFRRPVSLDM